MGAAFPLAADGRTETVVSRIFLSASSGEAVIES
jgi:hypothetical protein